jgi:hypothetical protein
MSSLISLCIIHLVKNSNFNIEEHELPQHFIEKYNVYKLVFNTLFLKDLVVKVKKEYPEFGIKEVIDIWNYKHKY